MPIPRCWATCQWDFHEAPWEYNELSGDKALACLERCTCQRAGQRVRSAWQGYEDEKCGAATHKVWKGSIVNCSFPCRKYPPHAEMGCSGGVFIHKYGYGNADGLIVSNQSLHQSFLSIRPSYRRQLGKPESTMLQIEWKSSHYHSDGRRRSRPKPSMVHGWLVKWRATFSGNERLRKEGIREMCEAKAVRELKKQRKAAKAARRAKAGASKSSLSLGEKERPQARRELSHASKRSSTKPPSRSSTRRLTSPTPSPKVTPAGSRRPSHNRQGSVLHSSRSSRKASHNSRGD